MGLFDIFSSSSKTNQTSNTSTAVTAPTASDGSSALASNVRSGQYSKTNTNTNGVQLLGQSGASVALTLTEISTDQGAVAAALEFAEENTRAGAQTVAQVLEAQERTARQALDQVAEAGYDATAAVARHSETAFDTLAGATARTIDAVGDILAGVITLSERQLESNERAQAETLAFSAQTTGDALARVTNAAAGDAGRFETLTKYAIVAAGAVAMLGVLKR